MFKNRITWKLFKNTLIIYLFALLIQVVFYVFVFDTYYKQQQINSIKEEIRLLMSELELNSESSFSIKLQHFTERTGYYTEYFDPNTYDSLTSAILPSLTMIDTDGQTYTVLIPPYISQYHFNQYFYKNSIIDEIKLLPHRSEQLYYPIYIDFKDGEEFEYDLELDSLNLSREFKVEDEDLIEVEGTIKDIVSSDHANQEFNLILMQYLLDHVNNNQDSKLIHLDNQYTFNKNHRGSYSITSTDLGNYLVFINEIQHQGNTYHLFTVTSLQPTESIIKVILKFTYLTFGVISFFLIFSTFAHAKLITKPLRKLNSVTKQMASFQFSTIPNINTNDEIGQLASSFNIMSINLENALNRLQEQNKQLSENLERENENEQIRKDFVAGVSHEMKTPLAVIMASSEALLHGVFTNIEEQHEQYELITKEVNKANKLINNMIEIYRLDQPAYEIKFSQFNIGQLIQNVIDELIHLIRSKQLILHVNIKYVFVYGDIDKIEMVISNLLTNAIKYSPVQETITILMKEIQNGYQIDIENTGTQIPEEALSKVHAPFYKETKEGNRHISSTGLGLYIVGLILKQHKSTYKIINNKNGVLFSFTLNKYK